MDESSIKAQVRELTAHGALIELNGQAVRWPAAALPSGTQAGETVRVRLLNDEQAKSEAHERARAILTEILGGRP